MSAARSRRRLRPRERRLLFVLAMPTLAMAFSATCVSTYLPVLARKFTGSTTVIGVIIVGFYRLSPGLGVTLGPLLAGVAIELSGSPFRSTHGYAAMWIVASGAILLSIPLLAGLRSRSGRRRQTPPHALAGAVKSRVVSVFER